MKEFSMRWVVASLITSSILSCKHQTGSSSEAKHEWGQNVRVDEPIRPGHCIEKSNLQHLKNKDDGWDYTEASNYIKKLTKVIMDSNLETFKDELDFKNFCFYVMQYYDDNAYTTPPKANIVFHDKMIALANNEAELAMVISHELAHLTMSHNNRMHPKLRLDAQYKTAVMENDAYESATTEALRANRDGFSKTFGEDEQDLKWSMLDAKSTIVSLQTQNVAHPELASVNQSAIDRAYADIKRSAKDSKTKGILEKIISSIQEASALSIKLDKEKKSKGIDVETELLRVLGPEYLSINASWTEQEADEVGYEFYLKAGFDQKTYGDQRLNSLSAEEVKVCDQLVLQMQLEGSAHAEKGVEIHPNYCWRRFNIRFAETAKHFKD